MPNYVKNPTWADGAGGNTPITAAKLNNVESGIFDAHYQAACRVYHSVVQTTTTAVDFTLAFDTESFDTESNASSTIHDTVTNNSRLTCRTAGKYLIAGNFEWAANATGFRHGWIALNGTGSYGYDKRAASSSGTTTNTCVIVLDLAVNDYVELKCRQDSGGNLDVAKPATGQSPAFAMTRIA